MRSGRGGQRGGYKCINITQGDGGVVLKFPSLRGARKGGVAALGGALLGVGGQKAINVFDNRSCRKGYGERLQFRPRLYKKLCNF